MPNPCMSDRERERERERKSRHLLAFDIVRKDRQNTTEKTLPALVARFVFPGLIATPDTPCWVWKHFENSSLRTVHGGYGTSTPTDFTFMRSLITPAHSQLCHGNIKMP